MITARVDTSTPDMFIRNRVRVLVEMTGPSPSDHTILGHNSQGSDFYIRDSGNPDESLPDGVTPWALDVPTDAARAVYAALKEHFEPKEQVPTIADRAYLDARADLLRAHALIDKLVDKLAAPTVLEGVELVSDTTRGH